MPAFSFEKITPPVGPDPAGQPEKKPHGFMVQLLDRFAERRAKRSLRKDGTDTGQDASE